MRGSLYGVADAIAISRATLRNIKQNLFGAFIYNSLGIPVAAGILYPLFGLLLNPMIQSLNCKRYCYARGRERSTVVQG